MIKKWTCTGIGTALLLPALFSPLLAGWTAGGTIVCSEPGNQYGPVVCSAGAKRSIIAWYDDRNGDFDIYAQMICNSGRILQPAGGVAVCAGVTRGGSQVDPQLVSDGTGGAIITWRHYMGYENDYDVYAQRLDANGTAMWTEGGVPVCAMFEKQTYPRLVPDGCGGAIIAWEDRRAVWPNADVYAQRIDPYGNKMWAADGVAVCTAGNRQMFPNIVSDDAGGAVITWNDRRSAVGWDIYAQRIDAAGVVLWENNGVAVCAAEQTQDYPSLCSPAPGEIVFSWSDDRGDDSDIYAQRIDAGGHAYWADNGRAVCTKPGSQSGPSITPDGAGGAILTWQDTRTGDSDIYALRLLTKGPVEAVLDIRPGSCPNPFNPKSRGMLPAAILGTDDLDVLDLDPGSILLEGVAPARWHYQDVSAPPADEGECACSPQGPDGCTDLALSFETQELAAALGRLSKGDRLTLTLTGRLADGTGLAASDCIVVRGNQDKPEVDASGRIMLTIDPTDAVRVISFVLPDDCMVEITVYDAAGRLVKRVMRSFEGAGMHSAVWNTSCLGSGIYFMRLTAGRQYVNRKIVLIR